MDKGQTTIYKTLHRRLKIDQQSTVTIVHGIEELLEMATFLSDTFVLPLQLYLVEYLLLTTR
jgi:hypothetical protein